MKPLSHYLLVSSIVLTLGCFGSATSQVVNLSADTSATLADRWKAAHSQSEKRNYDKGYWIGYSIRKIMGEHSFIGNYSTEPERNRPTLQELITGMHQEYDGESLDRKTDFDDEGNEKVMVTKEVGILFHFDSPRTETFDNLKVSNLSLRVDLDGDPLVWIGSAHQPESIAFLVSLYDNAGTRRAKKEIVTAVGLHNESEQAFSFLKKILFSEEHYEIRGQAAFWLGQTNNEEAEKILFEATKHDASSEVRDKTIFALSQMKIESATEGLITLAKTHPDTDTRKKAIFWLGQKASNKAVATLKDVVYSDENTAVQKSALFALAQLRDGSGVDDLIAIAKNHPNPKLRKDAIFWLGQSENPKALDAIIDIVRK